MRRRCSLWPKVKPRLKPGDALYFSHGFAIVYNDQTGVVPPEYVDVILVAPKGSGTSVRANFLAGSGINSSYAIHQDYTGRACERTLALGIAIGSGYLFPTTFRERSLQRSDRRARRVDGRAGGHHGSPVQRAAPAWTFAQRGLQRDRRRADPKPDPPGRRKTAWIGCTPTAPPPRSAARWTGALDSARRSSRCSTELYQSVVSGEETRIVLEANSAPDYREKLEAELKDDARVRNVAGRRGGAIVAP